VDDLLYEVTWRTMTRAVCLQELDYDSTPSAYLLYNRTVYNQYIKEQQRYTCNSSEFEQLKGLTWIVKKS